MIKRNGMPDEYMKQMKIIPKSLAYFIVRSNESPTINSFKSLWSKTLSIIFKFKYCRNGRKIIKQIWGKKAWIKVNSWIFDPTLWYHNRLKSFGKLSTSLNFLRIKINFLIFVLPCKSVKNVGYNNTDNSHWNEIENIWIYERDDEGSIDKGRNEQIIKKW